MKHIETIAALIVLLLLPVVCMGQNQLFGAYQSRQDVRYVCISHDMLQSLRQSHQLRIGNYDLAPVTDKIQTILIIRSPHQSGCRQMAYDAKRLQKDRNYQILLVRNIEGVSSMRLYRPKSKYPAEFIVYQQTDTEAIYIIVTGTFSAQEINKVF